VYDLKGGIAQEIDVNDNNSSHSYVYDAQNRLDLDAAFRADGTIESQTDYDQAGNQAWSFKAYAYDSTGHLSYERDNYDSGASHAYAFDAGKLDFEAAYGTDGKITTLVDYDQTGNQTWNTETFAYNPNGTISSEYIKFDNNSAESLHYDSLGRFSNETLTDSLGRATEYINVDQANLHNWREIDYIYNPVTG
jgi:hypothetical protein